MIDELLESSPEFRRDCRICGGPIADGCDCELQPGWVDLSDRITFRKGAADEIILRIPREDAYGKKSAMNHILTVAQARSLADELAAALSATPVPSPQSTAPSPSSIITHHSSLDSHAHPRP